MRKRRGTLRLDPNDGEAQLVLGHGFAYQGMAEQALEQFAKAERRGAGAAGLRLKRLSSDQGGCA